MDSNENNKNHKNHKNHKNKKDIRYISNRITIKRISLFIIFGVLIFFNLSLNYLIIYKN